MLEQNGSYSDVHKTKKENGKQVLFWLLKIRTLEETIEERCRVVKGTKSAGLNRVKCQQ